MRWYQHALLVTVGAAVGSSVALLSTSTDVRPVTLNVVGAPADGPRAPTPRSPASKPVVPTLPEEEDEGSKEAERSEVGEQQFADQSFGGDPDTERKEEMARRRADLDVERRDPGWASHNEWRLRENVDELVREGRLVGDVDRIECRSTKCLVRFTWDREQATSSALAELAHHGSDHCFTTVIAEPDSNDGTTRAAATLFVSCKDGVTEI